MPEIQRKLTFDMMRDFAHIGLIAETPMMIAVSPKADANSLASFVELSKRQPSTLFYAANGRAVSI